MAWVDQLNCCGLPRYAPADDRIYLYKDQVFGQYGKFLAAHEFAHALHYKAIEPWPSTVACPYEQRSIDDVTDLDCAFVEGFATFAAVWIAGTDLSGSNQDPESFERNMWLLPGYTDGGGSARDGSLIEGAVAALLIDMVDGEYTSDGVAGDDDTVEWPGSYVADLIKWCTPDGYISNIDGIDQFIYCAENDVNARLENPFLSWRVYSSAPESVTEPSTWTPARVRALWRWNLYNEGALP